MNTLKRRVDRREPLLSGRLFSVGRYAADGLGFTTVMAPGYHLVIQTGGLFIDRSGGDDAIVHAGMLAFFRPGRRYTTGDAGGCSSRAVVVTPSEAFLRDTQVPHITRALVHADGPAAVCMPAALSVRFRARLLGALRAGDPCGLEESLVDVDRALASVRPGRRSPDQRQSSATAAAHRDLVRAAIDTIARQPGRAWSLQELADRLFRSPFHLSRVVRAETGGTVGDLIGRLRVEHAANLLADTDLSIDQIARGVGYTHRGRLGVLFRRFTGQSPNEFRRACRMAERRRRSRAN